MAITKVPVELSSTTGIVDNSNATAITIDSSENVTFAGAITLPSSAQINASGALYLDSDVTHFRLNNETELMRIQASGVGIGTTSPDAMLRIDQDANSVAFKVTGGGSGVNIAEFTRDAGATASVNINASSGEPQIAFIDANTFAIGVNSTYFEIADNSHIGTNSRFVIDNTGNIGIGTTSPSQKLDVQGTILVNNEIQFVDSAMRIFRSSNDMRLRTGSSDRLTITSTGNVGILNTSPQEKLTIGSANNQGDIGFHIGGHRLITFGYMPSNSSNATYAGYPAEIRHDPTTGVLRFGIDTVSRTAGNAANLTTVLTISKDGNVGIGETSPDASLHITSNTPTISFDESDASQEYRIGSYGGTFALYDSTDSAYRFAVDGSGNFGIGTTSPKTNLEVIGGLNVSTNTTSATTTTMRIGSYGTSSQTYYGAKIVAHTNFTSTANTDLSFDLGNLGEVMRLHSNGSETRVGIKTTAPNGQLHIGDSNAEGSSANPALQIGGASTYRLGLYTDAEGAIIQNLNGDNGLQFRVKTAGEVMRIMPSGNVGIGTTSPSRQLTVQNSSDHSIIAAVSGTSNLAGMVMGDTSDDDRGAVLYNNNGDYMYFQTDAAERMRIDSSGNVGIGASSALDNKLEVNGGDIRVRGTSTPSIKFNNADQEVVGMRLQSGATGNLSFHTDKMVIDSSGKVGIGTTSPSGKLHVEGGRAGIISTDSSWGQFRVANSGVGEVGITVANGCTSSEFLSDSDPSSSNKFIMGISPYGAGTDTWGIGHGNLGDSVMHIDGSGNFGFGPHSENPHGYFEILKQKSGVDAPSDYELLFTLNSKGYFGNGYKAGLIRFCAGDTASGQDNFYAGIGCKTLTGTNNSEEGSLDFHVKNTAQAETLAVQIVGKAGTGIAGSGQHAKAMLFRYQGIAIDRVWGGYPGISVLNSSDYSTSSSTQSEFRVHGTNSASTAYPGTSGADFSVDFRVDGAYQTGSDRRRKKNITTIANALSTVKQLTGKKFQIVNRADEVQETTSKNGYKFGFIAQDVESIIPETIKYNADEDDGTENWNSAYSLDYGSLTALLVNAIKEQDTVIQDLKSRIETLEG